MRIFYSPESDPMLLDTAAALNALYEKISEFLNSGQEHISFPAIVNLNPAPYQELLNGLRIYKNNGGVKLFLSESRWLELTGSVGNLKQYVRHFYFQESELDNHHHPEYGIKGEYGDYMAKNAIDSIGLIIESNSGWGEDGSA